MKKYINYKLKILLCLFLLSTICIFSKYCYCISDNFKFVIDTIGIPEYNILGERINEDIYNIYKIFVYSDPIEVQKRTNLQRFKIVKDNGKWFKEDTFEKGEYYILGTNYSGEYITNVYFPVDFVPEVTPEYWSYLYNENSFNSWRDSSKYKYEEQLNYMKNSNLWFDKIDYENNICNSYELVEYNINANNIGINKVFLENCATWKTYGTVSIKRKTNDNNIRYATFFVKPMSANADIRSKLKVKDTITVEDLNSYIDITFGADAINLSDYAKEEHIKEIVSDIYINDIKVDTIKIQNNSSVEKSISYKIPIEDYDNNKKILNIKVKSYLHTEFNVDGLMQDLLERNITIHKDISLNNNTVPVYSIFFKSLEKNDNKYFIKSLIRTDKTDKVNSLGIIEKGKKLAIKISGNIKDNISIHVNGKHMESELLMKDKDSIVLKVNVEDVFLNTIATWNYLRQIKGNYFDIDLSKIGSRIKNPNLVTIKIGNDEYKFFIDVIDEFIYNINYTFIDNINNLSEINNKIGLEEWLRK